MSELIAVVVEDGSVETGELDIDDDSYFGMLSQRVQFLIDRDRRVARENGQTDGWTPFREMESCERIGAARCGSSEHRRRHTKRKGSVYVSYGVTFNAKIVRCEDCQDD